MNICSALFQREHCGSSPFGRNPVISKLPSTTSSKKERGGGNEDKDKKDDSSNLPDGPPPIKKWKKTEERGGDDDDDKGGSLLNLRIPIDDVIPGRALQSGHIVMGFTQCSRYILSYTIRPVQLNGGRLPRQDENRPLVDLLEFEGDPLYTYKLYFWQFSPSKGTTKKYSSVLLFDRNGIPDGNLMVQICQWKYESWGWDNDKYLAVVGRSSSPEDNTRCYLTLAQLPPSNPSCKKCTYTNWSSFLPQGLGQILSPCPTHSLAITLSFELVSPFPKFDPSTSLYITESDELDGAPTPTILLNTGNMLHQIQLNPKKQVKPYKSNLLRTELTQNHPELKYYMKTLVPVCDTKERRFFKRSTRQKDKDGKEVPKEFLPPPRPPPPPPRGQGTGGKPPDDVYEQFIEEEKPDKNYRMFRNRQLADKKYEFVDNESIVLRPQNSNLRKSGRNNRPGIFGFGGGGNSSSSSSKSKSSSSSYFKKCMARVTRSYVLLNEESVSTTTEIEDNEYNFNEYPVALPVNVYTDQTQLSMIPNYKAVDKKVTIVQTSLDIEVLSNEVANMICKQEGVRFVFLIDFDATVLHVHPKESTITSLVMILLLVSQSKDDNLRRRYETNYLFSWNPAAQAAQILFKGKLKESSVMMTEQGWNPTTSLPIPSARLYKQDCLHLNNYQMVHDWTSVNEITDSSGIVTLFRKMAETLSVQDQDFYDDEEEEEDVDDVSFMLMLRDS